MQFVINNIIILIIVAVMMVIYRRMDSGTRVQTRLNRTANKLENEITALVEEKIEMLKNIRVEVDVQQQTSRAIVTKAETLHDTLEARLQGIDNLKQRIDHYDDVLRDLAAMTENVEENMSGIQEESSYVDEVGKRIISLRENLEQTQHQADAVMNNLQESNLQQMQELEMKLLADFDSRADAVEERCSSSEKRVRDFEASIDDFRKSVLQLQEDSLIELERRCADIENDFKERFSVHLEEQLSKEQTTIRTIRSDFIEIEEQTRSLLARISLEQNNVFQSLEEKIAHLQQNFDQELDSSVQQHSVHVQEQRDILSTYFAEFSNRSEKMNKKLQNYSEQWYKKSDQEQERIFEQITREVEKNGKQLEKQLEGQMHALNESISIKQADMSKAFEELGLLFDDQIKKYEDKVATVGRADHDITATLAQWKEDFNRESETLHASLQPLHENVQAELIASQNKLQELEREMQSFISAMPDRLTKEHHTLETTVFTALDKRMSEFEQDLVYRLTKLEIIRQDIDLLDVEMHEIINRTTASLQNQFDDIPKQIDHRRDELFRTIDVKNEEIYTALAEIEREVNSVKSRAHIDLRDKIEVLSRDFLGNLSEKSNDMQLEIENFRAEFAEKIRTLEMEQYAKLQEEEQSLNKNIAQALHNLRTQLEGQIQDVDQSLQGVKENFAANMETTDRNFRQLASDLERKVTESREQSSEYFESQFLQQNTEMQNKLRSYNHDVDSTLRSMSEEVEIAGNNISSKIHELEGGVQNARSLFESQSATLFEQLEEDKISFHEEVRGIVTDAREQFFSQRHKLISKLEQNMRSLEENLGKIERRQREFIDQTKLFKRVEGMRAELQENLNYYKEELENLEQSRPAVRSLHDEMNKIQGMSKENGRLLLQLTEEKRRLDGMEAKYRNLSEISLSVERKVVDITQRDDELQELKSRFQHIEILEKDLGDRLERLDKKRTLIDVTIKNVDSNFDRIGELDSRIQSLADTLDIFSGTVENMSKTIHAISSDKEAAEHVLTVYNSLSDNLGNLEERLKEVQESREWLARSETRYENLGKEIEEQLKQLEHVIQGDLKQTVAKDKGAPSKDAQRTVLRLSKMGWSVDEIARATSISKGEVELILEISLRASY